MIIKKIKDKWELILAFPLPSPGSGKCTPESIGLENFCAAHFLFMSVYEWKNSLRICPMGALQERSGVLKSKVKEGHPYW